MAIQKWARSLANHLLVRVATIPARHQPSQSGALLADFVARCRLLTAPRVMELGTRRLDGARATRRAEWVPHAAEFVGVDRQPGPDVDIVADVHRLVDAVGEATFDIAIACSTFEHFKYPHLAAHQIMRTLKVGGMLFVQSHQTHPLHDHPDDFFRFSRSALAALFGARMGFRVLATDYEFPATIYASRLERVQYLPAFLNVRLLGEKIAPTPVEYLYEL